MAVGGHFGCPQITFDRIFGHFRSIRNFFFVFYKMAADGHFGWDDNVNYRTRPQFMVNSSEVCHSAYIGGGVYQGVLDLRI